MPAVSPRKGSSIGLMAIGPLSLAMLMPLPRINISFPKKHKGAQAAETEVKGENLKLVDLNGRRLTLFHEHRLLPRVSIVFPSVVRTEEEVEDISALSDEALIKQMILDEQGKGAPDGIEPLVSSAPLPISDDRLSLEDAIRKAMNEEQEAEALEVAKNIVNADGTRDVVLPGGVDLPEDGPSYKGDGSDTISQGSMVLVEGKKGAETRGVAENLCYGLLENGHTVTYITTALPIQDFIVEMHAHNYRIAQYLPDRQVLVIPVYPIIEGKGSTEELLDKLMSSSQLQTTDAIIVDSLSDFLGGHFDEVICMRLLEYLRRLINMGKTVFLVVEDGQKGILSLRLASDLHFALSAQEGKGVQVKRYHPPKEDAQDVLHFRIDPVVGLISQPRNAGKI